MNWIVVWLPLCLGADDPVSPTLDSAKAAASFAQSPSADEKRRQQLKDLLDESVTWNEFSVPGDESAPVTAVPVHRWTNNERDPHGQGLAILWIHRGQPLAMASAFPWNGRLIHELESTSRLRFQCVRDGDVVWQPQRGIAFARVPDAAAPDASAAVRLRQMKQIADRFKVIMVGWKADNSDREELRRLPRELFRYRPESKDVLDGAVFAYVKGTDPETAVILEAVQAGTGYEWQYALVRQTSGGLTAAYNDVTVWTAEKHIARSDIHQPWISLSRPLPAEVLP